MQNIFQKIDVLAKELESLKPLKPEYQQKLDSKFRLEFNFNSNHIEGNTLTYGETKLLLLFDDTKGNHSMREYEEMKAHDVAYKMIEDWARSNERQLTEHDIKNLNEIILVRPFWKDAITSDGQSTRRQIKVGDYKEFPNSVRLQNGEMFEYASPTDTPFKMQELLDWFREQEGKIPALELASMLHYKFVCIHPFDDGNGRLSRLLMNYVFLKQNLPPVVIKSSDKANYLRALHLADIGEEEAFVSYIGEQLIWSLELSIKAAKGESVEESDDIAKKIALLEQDLDRIDDGGLNVEYFDKILHTWVSDLLKKVIPAIQQFNRLFTRSRHRVYILDIGKPIYFVNESAEDIIKNLISVFELNKIEFKPDRVSIELETSYRKLIKGGSNFIQCNCSFTILFDPIKKYEIFLEQFSEIGGLTRPKIFEHQLTEVLNQNEINELTSKLVNSIYSDIDYKTKKNGLR